MCKNCYQHIRALRHIRSSLPHDVATIVACSIVSTRLDYCNALYYNMSESNFHKLQRVQNALAKTVLGQRKYDSATYALTTLHWLPIKHRNTFKIATLTYKTLRNGEPRYLRNLLTTYVPTRHLRSADQQLLNVPRTRTVTGTRAFRISAATIWNSLPSDLKNCTSVDCFKRHLKTFLFAQAYSS